MIDDLVTLGTAEPYRMFTSRAEYRLLLREDNADLRLCEHGRRVGLLDQDNYRRYRAKKEAVDRAMRLLAEQRLNPDASVNDFLQNLAAAPIKKPTTAKDLLRRNELKPADLIPLAPHLAELGPEAAESLDIEIKYEGYLGRQADQVRRFRQMENVRIPDDMTYRDMPGLSREVQEKLTRVQPRSLGQAGRISGVTPAAVAVLEVMLKKRGRPESPAG
jgi:tRNA uridine 5-carboxymethylaminomethyl modification enzyme